MAQLFSRQADTAFRVVLVLAVLAAIGVGAVAWAWSRSGSAWNVGVPAPQPIPFRHDLHSGALGLDCRYCHATVERAAPAGMPSAQTCMTCHSQVWAGASVLEPLRTSLALGQGLAWTSVHRLPAHAYFHHAAHVSKGVACETCHGRVDRMPRTVKAETLSMGWCLDCHRDPAPYLRPKDAVFAMGWEPGGWALPDDRRSTSAATVPRLTSCNTCHR
jgi:Cytochrome c7 and related cytochrome c